MTTSNDEIFAVVRSVESGKREYIVTSPVYTQEVGGETYTKDDSITVDSNLWPGDSKPNPDSDLGVYVMISQVIGKHGGLRALSIRFAKKSEREFHLNESEKQV